MTLDNVMERLGALRRRLSWDTAILCALALFFFALPTGTTPPLIAVVLAFVLWICAGRFTLVPQVLKSPWFWPVILFALLPFIGLTYALPTNLNWDYALKSKYWVLSFISATYFVDEQRLLVMVKALWAGLFAGAVIAMAQLAGVAPVWNPGHPGFGGVHTLMNMYQMIGILMAAFYFSRTGRPLEKIGLLVLMAAITFHLAVMQGRNGYLLFLVLSPAIIGHLIPRTTMISKLVACTVLAGLLVSSPIVQKRIAQTYKFISDNRQALFSGDALDVIPRFYLFKEAVMIVRDHPIIGIGTGSMPEATGENGDTIDHPHNNILYMAVSFGAPGIASLMWLFGTLFMTAWPRRGDPLGYFVLMTGVVLFLGGLFDTQIINTCTLVLLTVVYGFLSSLTQHGKGRD